MNMKLIVWLALAAAVWYLFYWMEKRFRQTQEVLDRLTNQQGELAQQIAQLPPSARA
jgi:hypothetical protein